MSLIHNRFKAIGDLKKQAAAIMGQAGKVEREILADKDFKRKIYDIAHKLCTLAYNKMHYGCYENGMKGFAILRDEEKAARYYRANIYIHEKHLSIRLQYNDHEHGWVTELETDELKIPLCIIENPTRLDEAYGRYTTKRDEQHRQERIKQAREQLERAQHELSSLGQGGAD